MEQSTTVRHDLVGYGEEQLFDLASEEIKKDPERGRRAIEYLTPDAITTEGESCDG